MSVDKGMTGTADTHILREERLELVTWNVPPLQQIALGQSGGQGNPGRLRPFHGRQQR